MILGGLAFEDRAIGVLHRGDRVYVAAGSEGLRVLDANRNRSPQEISSWSMPGAAERLLPFGDKIYVAAEMGGLQLVSPNR